ncbi:MAG: hypothetical protein DGJ47_000358 [Rickettsiaceae bacterium]
MDSFFTNLQENLLFSAELKYGQPIYTIKEIWPIPFNTNIEKLKSVITNIIASSDALRFSYFYDFRDNCLKKKISTIDPIWTSEDFVFDMTDNLLFVSGVYEELGTRYFKLQFHHSLLDGWSVSKLMKKISALYNSQAVNPALEYSICDHLARLPSNKKFIKTHVPFLKDSHEDFTCTGKIIRIEGKKLNNIMEYARLNKVRLFSALVYRIIDSLKLYYNLDSIDFAIPFAARTTNNLEKIGMLVDTQLLSLDKKTIDNISPSAVQNLLLELLKKPKSLSNYHNTPRIMLNFIDLDVLKLKLNCNDHASVPYTILPDYCLFDLHIEFRKENNFLDVMIFHKKEILNINSDEFYSKITQGIMVEGY